MDWRRRILYHNPIGCSLVQCAQCRDPDYLVCPIRLFWRAHLLQRVFRVQLYGLRIGSCFFSISCSIHSLYLGIYPAFENLRGSAGIFRLEGFAQCSDSVCYHRCIGVASWVGNMGNK